MSVDFKYCGVQDPTDILVPSLPKTLQTTPQKGKKATAPGQNTKAEYTYVSSIKCRPKWLTEGDTKWGIGPLNDAYEHQFARDTRT